MTGFNNYKSKFAKYYSYFSEVLMRGEFLHILYRLIFSGITSAPLILKTNACWLGA